MIKTMDTKIPHPDDVARMPNSTASTPTGFLNDLLECLNYGRKSPGIAGEWKRSLRELYPFCHSWSPFCQPMPILLFCKVLAPAIAMASADR